MNCGQCQGIEREFNQGEAAGKLKSYRERGPAETTRLLIEAVKASGVQGLTVLDIGGGIGAVQYGLLEAGAEGATSVEASSAYLRAAQDEARRQAWIDRIRYAHGNFVELAAEITPADIVTLDRVICCYHDMPALVGLSAARARKVYGLVYPRDSWWVRLGIWLENLIYRLQGSPFRAYVHAPQAVEAILREQGLRRRYHKQNLAWQVAVYTRA
jgi:magnesium-protoporphyrin O-methyltransferase